MAWTPRGSGLAFNGSGFGTTTTIPATVIGDILLLTISASTSTPSAPSGAGVTTWNAARVITPGSFGLAWAGGSYWGVVTSVATTISCGSSLGWYASLQAVTPPVSASLIIRDTSGSGAGGFATYGTSSSGNMPSVTPVVYNPLYLGMLSAYQPTTPGGSTSGFTYIGTGWEEMIMNPNPGAGAVSPNWTLATNGGSVAGFNDYLGTVAPNTTMQVVMVIAKKLERKIRAPNWIKKDRLYLPSPGLNIA